MNYFFVNSDMEVFQNHPTYFDFCSQVNISNFDQEELDFQKKIMLNANFKTWDDYLQNRYHLYSHILDAENYANELTSPKDDTITFSGDLKLNSNKHINHSVIDKAIEGHEQLSNLPINEAKQIENFEIKLITLYTRLLINKNKDASTTLNAILKDYENQTNVINSPEESCTFSPLSYIEAISLPNLNKAISEAGSKNYYFPGKAIILNPLAHALVDLKCIETTDDFEKTFKFKKKQSSDKRPLWIASVPMLLYLLYRLNNNNEYVPGARIEIVASELFRFTTEKTPGNFRSAFTKTSPKFNDEEKLSKKIRGLKNLLDNLIK